MFSRFYFNMEITLVVMQYLSFKIPNINNKKTTSSERFNYISTLKIYLQLDYLYS